MSRRRSAARCIEYRVGAPGGHWVMNSLAVLATVAAFGGDLAPAAASLARMTGPGGARRAPPGGGRRGRGRGDRRKLQRQSRVDAGGDRDPGRRAAGARGPAHRRARRHARAGSRLGPPPRRRGGGPRRRRRRHRAQRRTGHGAPRPGAARGGRAAPRGAFAGAGDATARAAAAGRRGDGEGGPSAAAWAWWSRPCSISTRASGGRGAHDAARRPARAMEGLAMLFNLLFPFADDVGVFNLFRYLTFRTGGAVVTARSSSASSSARR